MLATVSPQVRNFRYLFAPSASFWPLFHPTCVILATFSPHQSPQHTHNILQLPLFGPFSSTCKHFDSFFEKMLPASVGITFLQINPMHFDAKTLLSGPPGGGKNTDVGNCFATSASFALLVRHKCILWNTFSPEVRHFADFFNPPKAPNVCITSSSSHFLLPFFHHLLYFHSYF